MDAVRPGFETLACGRRHVVMGANRVDRYGNQKPRFGRRCSGRPGRCLASAAAGQHHQPRHQLLGGNHCKRVFVEAVDGLRLRAKVDPDNWPSGCHLPVVSNLACSTGGLDHSMRAVSLHPGDARRRPRRHLVRGA